jgi:hypothetical protein
MSDRRATIATVLVTLGVVALIVGIGVTAFVAGRAARTVDQVDGAVEQVIDAVTAEGEYAVVGEVTVESIRNLAELTTIEVVEYTTVEKGNDEGILNWAVGEKLEMFAVARIGAGVDLDQLEDDDVFADPATGRVIIRLPAATITYVEVDNERTHVYNRETGVFTKGDPDLERAARITAEEALVNQALADDLLGQAEDRAQVVLEDLLASLGYSDISIVVAEPEPVEDPTLP